MLLKVLAFFFFFLSLVLVVNSSMSSLLVENVQNALKYHQAGDISAALPLYEQALSEKDSLNANVVSMLASNVGSIYMSLGEYEKAALKFEIAIEATPEKVESHYNYAVVLNSKLGDNGKALKHCARAMKLDPNFYKAYHLMGNVLQDLGRPEKADEYFVRAENIAKALGVEDPGLARPQARTGFSLDSIWMFQNAEVNKAYDIPVPQHQQERLGKTTITVICLSAQPLIFEIPLLLNVQECDHIKATATPKLELSHVMGSKVNPTVDDQASPEITPEPYRSSYNAWLPLDPVLISLQERIAFITTLPRQYISLKSEELQVVKYETGGQFKMHQDSSAFNPRLFTALIYLQDHDATEGENERDSDRDRDRDATSNAQETCPNAGGGELCEGNGGETLFPFANVDATGSNAGADAGAGAVDRSDWTVDDALLHLSQQPQETLKTQGLAVQPSRGKAIIFFNHRADGSVDPLAVHSGSKLVRGTKWIANYWVELDLKTLNDMPAAAAPSV
jgi:hypothetical protein